MEFLNPNDVFSAVAWPSPERVTKELESARRQLVRVLVDRVNRNGTTPENQRAYTEAMAAIGFFYNPSQITGFKRYSRAHRVVVNAYKTENIGKKGASPKHEIAAVLAAISTITGRELTSVLDIA